MGAYVFVWYDAITQNSTQNVIDGKVIVIFFFMKKEAQ